MHDLAAPIRQTNGFLDLLAIQISEEQPKAKEFLGHAQAANQRMGQLVQSVHEYLKLEDAQEHEKIALTDLVEKIIQPLQEKTTFELSSLPNVMGNRSHLGLLFHHLIENALLYNASDSPKITISAEQAADGSYQISVQDNGIGIAPEMQEEIFKPFKRLQSEADYPGVGMGLTLVQKIAKQHGGDITCQSELGQGSVFRVVLVSG